MKDAKRVSAPLLEYATAWIAARYRDLRSAPLLPSPSPAFETRRARP